MWVCVMKMVGFCDLVMLFFEDELIYFGDVIFVVFVD